MTPAWVMGQKGRMRPGGGSLRDLLAAKSLRKGAVKLSNGQSSTFYFDCKKVTLDPEGASLVADAFLDVISELPVQPTAIGGRTMGADPILGAVMMRALEHGQRLQTFYVRKEPKAHGTMQWIENPPAPGSKVVIVDDVVTTGKSALEALRHAKDAGCDVLAVIGLVDRGEGGGKVIQQECSNYVALYTLTDFPEIADVQPLKQLAHSR